MTVVDWLALFAHFLSLSLLAVGGAIAVAPDMHRFLVDERGWIDDGQFSASVALAQAAPGPNVLFIPVLGLNVGLQAGGLWHGLLGMSIALAGILLPSSVLTLAITRWAHRHREDRGVRAFKQGMAPVVIALLLATAWVLTSAHPEPVRHWPLWLLTAVSALIVWRTRVHLLWLLAAGALLGAAGVV